MQALTKPRAKYLPTATPYARLERRYLLGDLSGRYASTASITDPADDVSAADLKTDFIDAFLHEIISELARQVHRQISELEQQLKKRTSLWSPGWPAQRAESRQEQGRAEDGERMPEPEFVWSKTLYRARKAAQEFSEETHADH